MILNARQERFLAALGTGGAATRAEYQACCPCGVRTAKRDLTGLQAAGLLTREGASTASRYRRKERPMEALPETPQTDEDRMLMRGSYRVQVVQPARGPARVYVYNWTPEDDPPLLMVLEAGALHLQLRSEPGPAVLDLLGAAQRQIAARVTEVEADPAFARYDGPVPEAAAVPSWLGEVSRG